MKTVLQVALDLLNLDRAVAIAKEAIEGYQSCWLEAGTPLIKSEGMNAVRTLRKTFPDHTIVADMKTMDTGALETEMAAKAGADIVCILGVSDMSTITDALKSARNYGAKLMVDLIGIEDMVGRARELEELGVDYLCLHVGIDEQMMGKQPLSLLKKIITETKIPLAVAGGLNSETVADVVTAGAAIIIVGGAITKAKDVTRATKVIAQAIETQKSIATKLYKKYETTHLREAFSLVSTPNITDAMHRKGAMTGIRPIKLGYHMVGRALTVRTIDGDWAKPIEAIDKAEKGSVLVVDAQQGTTAVWGELATWSATLKGLAGVVIDGAMRDLDDIVTMELPLFTRHIASNAGEPKGFGEIGAEIQCGGQRVRTGDWIIGDDSGVVVVPQEISQEIANRAIDVKEQENRIRKEIKAGGSLNSVLKVKKWEKNIG
jgi:3-hexulose-6-phosphate synthase/6-phospho-3-hexuloisomerase